MTTFDKSKAWKIHAICGVLHATSTIVIAALALKNGSKASDYETYVNKDFFSFTEWKIFCYRNGTYFKYFEANTTDADCPDSTKLFLIERDAKSFDTPINILFVALSFTSVSAFVHFLSALLCVKCSNTYTLAVDSILRFAVDYALSSSLMLSLVNIVYGANNVSGVILGPALLALALWLSAWLLYSALKNPAYTNKTKSTMGLYTSLTMQTKRLFAFTACCSPLTLYIICFVILILMYFASLAPTVAAIANAGKLAPTAVVIFMSGLLVAFSCFIVPYAFELFYKREYYCFLTYNALSLVAKAILHSFLAVSVLQQAQLYDNAKINVTDFNLDPPEDMTSQRTEAIVIIIVTPTVGTLLYFAAKKLGLDPVSSDSVKNVNFL